MNLTQKEENLAFQIAETLNDAKSLLVYERFVQRYSESFLLEILSIVMKIESSKIKNSRGAYFTYLVNQRANSQKSHDRN